MKRCFVIFSGWLLFAGLLPANPAATSVNTFGLDLHRRLSAGGGNLVVSPWSIQSALAMTWGGAAGATREEMSRVLQFSGAEPALHEGFARLAADLAGLEEKGIGGPPGTEKDAKGAPGLEINTANRLFGEESYPFLESFLKFTDEQYGAPLEPLSFRKNPGEGRQKINGWVAAQTRNRIPELVPAGVIDKDTRLVLVNAVYLKAPWAVVFDEEPGFPFHVGGGESVKVPGLVRTSRTGILKIPEGVAITIPYSGGGLHFLLMVPDRKDGLPELEKKLDPRILEEAAKAPQKEIRLRLPSFKLEPSRVMLRDELVKMGMTSAFDIPEGSADFSKIAPVKPDDYLFISEVIHQAFVSVDKNGTEAAASTAVVMPRATSLPVDPPEPLEIKVDRPFAFAIQHAASGTCLFLGRVTDPR